MKYSKEEKDQAFKAILPHKGQKVYAIINSVSRSGMSRRIEFYVVDKRDNEIERIGWEIARLLEYPYDADKGGLSVQGAGMDMIFHVLSNLNYRMATLTTGKTIQELIKGGERIYDKYFFNADQYRRL